MFHEGDWKKLLEIDTDHIGTGMSVKQANELSRKINLLQLQEYNLEVKKRSLQLIPTFEQLDSQNLASESELDQKLKNANAFPEGTRQNRAKAYAPTSVSSGILGVLNHNYMHFGQYLAVMKPL